jgi:hypothetical protein
MPPKPVPKRLRKWRRFRVGTTDSHGLKLNDELFIEITNVDGGMALATVQRNGTSIRLLVLIRGWFNMECLLN